VNASFVYKQKIVAALHSLIPFSSFTYQEVTPTLSRFFLGQVWGIIIAAFVLISIAVLVIFRAWAPSLAIIFGAGNDMIIA
ncbi:MAG: protein translocase subunit SecF, partial [Candidatus Micrarchaeota archaeon]|nr:protein translocase subunit SecF [Candidatus Micrarchaeota archaeon]